MSAHLTTEEFTSTLMGVSSLTVNAHLMDCPACAEEFEKLRGAIASFHSAAHAWSEGARASDRRAIVIRPLTGPWPLAEWILAGVMTLFLAAAGLYLHDYRKGSAPGSAQVQSPASPSQPAQSQIERDNELLANVYNEISEGVPAPMQPLQITTAASARVVSK